MLTWREGPRDAGCVYHKKAAFRSAVGLGQVDVFVMPRIKAKRPIAITINVGLRGDRHRRLKGSLAGPDAALSLEKRLTPRLEAIGIGAGQAAALVHDIIGFIASQGNALYRALK
jgi:hypothetical protein